MKKTALSPCLFAFLLGFSGASFALDDCNTQTNPLPTQLKNQNNKTANCTCKPPRDCEVPICLTLPQFKKKCAYSPSSLIPDVKEDGIALKLALEP